METKDGVPYLERDPMLFERVLQILTSSSKDEYTKIDKEIIEELTFFGITDIEETNKKQLQKMFNINPRPQNEIFTALFSPPIDISDGSFPEIDHSLEFNLEGIQIEYVGS